MQLDSRLRLLEQQMQLEEDEPRENPLLSLVVSQQGRPNAMVTVDVRDARLTTLGSFRLI